MNKEILEWINKNIEYKIYELKSIKRCKGPICEDPDPIKADLKILNQIKKELEEKDKMQIILESQENIKEKPILDDAEKRYLKNFLRPFKDEVESIYKSISVYHEKADLTIELKTDIIRLPYFETGTMYKGMEVGKSYTLDKLGIKYE